jgi:tetratricopeptide (TPR) repeat protein
MFIADSTISGVVNITQNSPEDIAIAMAAMLKQLGVIGKLDTDGEPTPEQKKDVKAVLDKSQQLTTLGGKINAWTEIELGETAKWAGLHRTAQRHFSGALDTFKKEGARYGEAKALDNLAELAEKQDDFAEAERLYREAKVIWIELGERTREVISSFGESGSRFSIVERHVLPDRFHGIMTMDKESRAAAFSTLDEESKLKLLAAWREVNNSSVRFTDIYNEVKEWEGKADTLIDRAKIAIENEDLAETEELLNEVVSIRREIGDREDEWNALVDLGFIMIERNKSNEAKQLFQEALRIRLEIGRVKLEQHRVRGMGALQDIWKRLPKELQQWGYQASLDFHRAADDREGEAEALDNLAEIAGGQDDFAEAQRLYRESLAIARDIGDKKAESMALGNLGLMMKDRNDFDEAKQLFQESLRIRLEIGSLDEDWYYEWKYWLSNIHKLPEEMQQWGYQQSLEFHRAADNREGEAEALEDLARIAERILEDLAQIAEDQDDFAEVQRLYQESLAFARESGDRKAEATALHELERIARDQDDFAEVQRLYQESLAFERESGDRKGEATALKELARIARDQDDFTEAQRLSRESLAIMRDIGDRKGEATALEDLARIARDQDDFTEAQRLSRESLAIMRDIGDREGEAWALEGLALIAIKQGDISEIERRIRESIAVINTVDDEGLGNLNQVIRGSAADFRWLMQKIEVHSSIRVAIEEGDQIEEQRRRQVALAISKGMGDQHDEAEQAQSTTGKKSTKMLKKLKSVFGRKPKNPGAPPPFPDPDAE